MSLFSKIEKRVGVSLTDPGSWFNDIEPGAGPTHSGKSVNSHNALGLSAVYFCSGLIADSISSLPADCFRPNGKSGSKPVKKPDWLIKPNPQMYPQDFWHRVITSMVMEGNGYIFVVRNPDNGKVDSLWPIHPHRVSILHGGPNGRNIYLVNGTPVPDGDMIHIPAYTVAGQLKGLSVIEVARQAIGLGMTAEEFGARFFSQGTTMAGVISTPAALKPEEATRLKADFSKRNSGTKNSHAVGVLTGGAQWTNISVTPEQAQFLETRSYTKVDIALFFRVPPYMVDPTVASSWGKGIEEQNWSFVQNTLQPWITRIEQAISLFLLSGTTEMRFNLNARLRAKTTERMDSYAKGLQNGWYCVDDVRALEDMEPLPDGLGQKFFRMANLIELGAEPVAPPLTANPDPADDALDPADTGDTVDDSVVDDQGSSNTP